MDDDNNNQDSGYANPEPASSVGRSVSYDDTGEGDPHVASPPDTGYAPSPDAGYAELKRRSSTPTGTRQGSLLDDADKTFSKQRSGTVSFDSQGATVLSSRVRGRKQSMTTNSFDYDTWLKENTNRADTLTKRSSLKKVAHRGSVVDVTDLRRGSQATPSLDTSNLLTGMLSEGAQTNAARAAQRRASNVVLRDGMPVTISEVDPEIPHALRGKRGIFKGNAPEDAIPTHAQRRQTDDKPPLVNVRLDGEIHILRQDWVEGMAGKEKGWDRVSFQPLNTMEVLNTGDMMAMALSQMDSANTGLSGPLKNMEGSLRRRSLEIKDEIDLLPHATDFDATNVFASPQNSPGKRNSNRASALVSMQSTAENEQDHLKCVLSIPGMHRTNEQIRFIRKFVDHVEFFQDYSQDVLNEVCRRCRMLEQKPGQLVFYQGEPGDALYVILSGTVGIYVRTLAIDYKSDSAPSTESESESSTESEQTPESLDSDGLPKLETIIDELKTSSNDKTSSNEPDSPPVSSVRNSSEDIYSYRKARDSCDSFGDKASRKGGSTSKKSITAKTEPARKPGYFSRKSVKKMVDRTKSFNLNSYEEENTAKEPDKPQNEEQKGMKYLLKAHANVVRDSNLGKRVNLLHQGSAFGEYALITNAPRAASIACHSECDLLTLDAEDFQACLKVAMQKTKKDREDFLRRWVPGLTGLHDNRSFELLSMATKLTKYPRGHVFHVEAEELPENLAKARLHWIKSGDVALFVNPTTDQRELLKPKPLGEPPTNPPAAFMTNRKKWISTVSTGQLLGLPSALLQIKEAFTAVVVSDFCESYSIDAVSVIRCGAQEHVMKMEREFAKKVDFVIERNRDLNQCEPWDRIQPMTPMEITMLRYRMTQDEKDKYKENKEREKLQFLENLKTKNTKKYDVALKRHNYNKKIEVPVKRRETEKDFKAGVLKSYFLKGKIEHAQKQCATALPSAPCHSVKRKILEIREYFQGWDPETMLKNRIAAPGADHDVKPQLQLPRTPPANHMMGLWRQKAAEQKAAEAEANKKAMMSRSATEGFPGFQRKKTVALGGLKTILLAKKRASNLVRPAKTQMLQMRKIMMAEEFEAAESPASAEVSAAVKSFQKQATEAILSQGGAVSHAAAKPAFHRVQTAAFASMALKKATQEKYNLNPNAAEEAMEGLSRAPSTALQRAVTRANLVRGLTNKIAAESSANSQNKSNAKTRMAATDGFGGFAPKRDSDLTFEDSARDDIAKDKDPLFARSGTGTSTFSRMGTNRSLGDGTTPRSLVRQRSSGISDFYNFEPNPNRIREQQEKDKKKEEKSSGSLANTMFNRKLERLSVNITDKKGINKFRAAASRILLTKSVTGTIVGEGKFDKVDIRDPLDFQVFSKLANTNALSSMCRQEARKKMINKQRALNKILLI